MSVKCKKWVCLGIMLMAGLLLYLQRVTYSGLWYDEAIEYFFSKVLFGEVPGGLGKLNMYERICDTYQPPLYNILMYAWLLIFDSEYMFRLAGVLLTLFGALGVFFAIEEYSNYRWAMIGGIIYLTTTSISYYALESGEYNLMLSCVAWVVCFFVRVIKRRNTKSLMGFFVFSCLAVYSQYGAAFLVAGAYISLVIFMIVEKDVLLLKRTISATGIIGVVAVLPLIIFFLIPQMGHQGADIISHVPVYEGNILYDIYKSLRTQVVWNFTAYMESGDAWRIPLLIVVMAGGMTIIALFQKHKALWGLIFTCVISWLIYYVAVITSFYAYNSWSGSLRFGNRYGVFFTPLWIVMLVYGVVITMERIKEKINRKEILLILALAGSVASLMYCGMGANVFLKNWKKDDVREVAQTWYKEDAYKVETLVHQWSDASFQFYLRHHVEYNQDFQDNIITAGHWIRSAGYEEMKYGLEEMEIFEYEKLYYIGPAKTYGDSFQAFINVMEETGYKIETLWQGDTALLYLEK